MAFNFNNWEKYLDKLKYDIVEATNNCDLGVEIIVELNDLYNILDNKKLPLEVRKQKAVIAEHYLSMVRDIPNIKRRGR